MGRSTQVINRQAHEQPEEVLFFGTCLLDLIEPGAGLDGMRLITYAGTRVRFPQDRTCCGQPAYNAGFRRQARAVARRQLETLSGDAPVIVPSASCAGMFREHYPRLFADTPQEAQARQLAARVVELCEFLDRALAPTLSDLGEPAVVALHHSCSARRETRTAAAAARLLARLGKLRVIEPDHAHECCGFGGTFAVKQPEISAAMAADKARALTETGAALAVSQDFGCLMNLDGTARKAGLGLRCLHIATLMWARVNGEAPP